MKRFFICTLVLLITSGTFSVWAQQTPVEPKQKVVLVPKKTPVYSSKKSKDDEMIDSLTSLVEEYGLIFENQKLLRIKNDSIIRTLDSQLNIHKSEINNLEIKNSNYKGQNLKLDQSNRILIIFNSVVGVLLLATLIWFLRNIGKKKSVAGKNKNTISNFGEMKSGIINDDGYENLGQKLEQLERLSKLKDKGVLSEEEFNRQKQQILG